MLGCMRNACPTSIALLWALLLCFWSVGCSSRSYFGHHQPSGIAPKPALFKSTEGPRSLPIFRADTGAAINWQGLLEAIEWADVLNVLRLQLERMQGGYVPSLREYNRIWGLSSRRLEAAPKDVLVLHPGPMNRGVEIDSDVADGPHSVILNQVTNGVAIRMAVLYLLAGGRPEKAEAAKEGAEA